MSNYKKSKDYLSNKEMFAEVMQCQETGLVSNKLGKMYMLMATRYATKPNFSGYTYKDEMINAGVVSCCAALNSFNSEKSVNTFAYFTAVIHNSFLQVLNKERKQQNIKNQLLLDAELTPSFNFIEREKEKFKQEQNKADESDDTADIAIDIEYEGD